MSRVIFDVGTSALLMEGTDRVAGRAPIGVTDRIGATTVVTDIVDDNVAAVEDAIDVSGQVELGQCRLADGTCVMS